MCALCARCVVSCVFVRVTVCALAWRLQIGVGAMLVMVVGEYMYHTWYMHTVHVRECMYSSVTHVIKCDMYSNVI